MPVTINVKVAGLDQMKRSINNLAEKIEHPDDKFARRIGDALLEDTDRRFMTRGYGTWPENKPETVKRKGHGNVLIDSGAMMASTKVQRIGNNIKLTVPYGGKNHDSDVPDYHQEGRGHLPKRKIVEATSRLASALVATYAVWLRDIAASFGKGL